MTVAANGHSRRRRRVWWVIGGILVVVVLIATPFVVQYRRQIESYLTHWKGSPTHTVAYRPYTPAPELHVGVAGDIGDSGARLDATGRAMAKIGRSDPYDVLLLLGDNVYPSGDPEQLPEHRVPPVRRG